jgi:oligopeptide/dipeptide ABC transporter ATP-binding protein
MALLDIRNLTTRYTLGRGEDARHLDAVDDVTFSVEAGEVFGLVGESGCGKSTIAQSVLRLLPRNGAIVDGSITFDGTDLTELSQSEMRKLRWERISVISQSAMNAFDPVYTVGAQIREAINAHRDLSRREMDERIRELFEVVGIDPDRVEDYPHQFSGGMKQRAMIAMSLVLDPDLIIADEPTTALDVISQDTILHYLEELQLETDAAILLITHDMSVVAELCDRIGVMYAGKLAEQGRAEAIFAEPLHPYTMGLKNAFPRLKGEQTDLVSIAGSPPDLVDIGAQCRFAERCPFAIEDCWSDDPPIVEYGGGHEAACLRIDELGATAMRERAARRETWRDATTPEPAAIDGGIEER